MPGKKSTVLVTGATGAVGPRVVHALCEVGYPVRAFAIDEFTEGMFPQKVEVLIGDVTDKAAVQSAMKNVETVVHMAALLHIVNPAPSLRDKYEHININGTATVIEAAINAGVKRIVLFSTIAVYGPSSGTILNELSATHADTLYAKTKLVAEQLILNAKNADGQPMGTVLRLGAIYGSRIKGNYAQLTRNLAHHCFISIGNGHNRRTVIYDKDVGRVAVLTAFHPAAAGRVFNVTDGKIHTLSEIVEAICLALGRNFPRFSIPPGAILGLIGLIEKGCISIGMKPPLTREMIYKYIEDVAVDGSLIQRELGFIPQYDLKNGWEETIREMWA